MTDTPEIKKLNGITLMKYVMEVLEKDGEHINTIDAVLEFCERNEVDVESAAKLVRTTPSLKALVRRDSEELNFIEKSTTHKLPMA